MKHKQNRAGYAMLLVPRDVYGYFEELTPSIEPEVGYSLLLYDVTLDEANRVRRRIGLAELKP